MLDTSALIDFPAAEVAEAADLVAVSSISIGELQYGVGAAGDPLVQLRRRRRVQAVVERFDVLGFDAATAEYYGALANLIRRHGRDPGPRRIDLQIAATAARHDLIPLTRDGMDFTGLEAALRVVNLPPQSAS
ncbi:MAG: PIN domain-containing protein [Sporichthyaceae bacterium]